MSKKGNWTPTPRFAQVHTHFNLNRDIHDPNEGEVTIEERIKAVARFITWHERQVKVGHQLLLQLTEQLTAAGVTGKHIETPTEVLHE